MLRESDYVKIVTAVPLAAADQVREALGDAGAGKMNNYKHCSGSVRCVGRFIALPGAHPAIGQVGKLEAVTEEIIEVLCHKDLIKPVVAALRAAHPYEEPPIDIIPRYELE